jgi:hypothetical protein
MNSPVSEVFIFAFVVPFIVVIIVVVLLQRKAAAETGRSHGIQPSYAPVDFPPAGFLLRRFSTPERAFLLQLRSALLLIGGTVAYVFVILMCAGLFPRFIAKFGLPGGGQLSIWHSYLFGITLFAGLYTILAVILGFIARGGIGGARAVFLRTRPISRRLIFWGRIAPGVAALLTAFALAVGLSLLMLVVCYGPVFNHLSDPASQLRVASFDHDATVDLAHTLQTSACRLFLSTATTLLLDFSFVVASCSLPMGDARPRSVVAGALILLGILSQTFLTLFREDAPKAARFFFLYSNLGPPPPYVYAAVPIVVSIALLVLASFFDECLEI